MIYKRIWIDLDCTYMPEIKKPNSIHFITEKTPCVAHLPDIERGFGSIKEAKKYIDQNLKRIRKKEKERAKKFDLPF